MKVYVHNILCVGICNSFICHSKKIGNNPGVHEWIKKFGIDANSGILLEYKETNYYSVTCINLRIIMLNQSSQFPPLKVNVFISSLKKIKCYLINSGCLDESWDGGWKQRRNKKIIQLKLQGIFKVMVTVTINCNDDLTGICVCQNSSNCICDIVCPL